MVAVAEVRFAEKADLRGCKALDRETTAQIIENKISAREVVVAVLGDRIVGYLRLEYLWSREPYIGLIFVKAERRGRGIGEKHVAFPGTRPQT